MLEGTWGGRCELRCRFDIKLAAPHGYFPSLMRGAGQAETREGIFGGMPDTETSVNCLILISYAFY